MKPTERLKGLNPQTRWMIALIVLLIVMIATRWGYISRTAGTAFHDRFAPPAAQSGGTAVPPTDSTAAQSIPTAAQTDVTPTPQTDSTAAHNARTAAQVD